MYDCSSSFTFTLKQLFKRLPEVNIEDSIDDRVETGVDVAEPYDECDETATSVGGA